MNEVKITGPGGCINYEYYVILKALQDAGFEVIEDNYAPEENSEEFVKEIRRRIDTGFIESPHQVKLVANHVPWGG